MLLVMLKSAVVLALAAVVVSRLPRAAAATRRLVLASAVVGVLAIPILSALLPTWGLWNPPAAAEDPAFDVAEVVLAPLDLGALQPPQETEATSPAAALVGDGGGASDPPAVAAAVSGPALTWTEAFFELWGVGALCLFVRLLFGLHLTLRLKLSALHHGTVEWDDSLDAAVRELGLVGPAPGLMFSDRTAVPLAAGIVWPTICLPLEALQWDEPRRRLVLLHELAHVRHHDNSLSLLGQLVCCVHWFNPLAWWVVGRLAVESERSADDTVLRAGARPVEYALELVDIVRDGRGVAAASAMARPAELEARVASILDPRSVRRGLSRWKLLLLATVGLAALAMLSCAREYQVGADEESASGQLEAAQSSGSSDALARAVAQYYGVSPSGVELTIDDPLQGIVDDEVRQLVDRYHPSSVTVIALEPCTGQVLALGAHDAAGAAPAPRALEPGSTMKPLTVAAALEEGMSPNARYLCASGAWTLDGATIRDASPADWLDVSGIVVRSSTIGVGRIYQQELGWQSLRTWLGRFRIADRPALQLPGVEAGAIAADRHGDGVEPSALEAVYAANGLGVRANQIQLVAAYAALANDGVYNTPTLARRVRDDQGRVVWEHEAEGERVVSESTANAVVGMLEQAVADDSGTGRNARVDGVTIAGKTGTTMLPDDESDGSTSEYYASFVGIVGDEDPQMVILVGIEGLSGPDFTGGQVAAPAFARIVSEAQQTSAPTE